MQKEIKERADELELILALREEFKDLNCHVDRWKRVRYSSTLVNQVANEYDINHSCGCCSDAALLIRPYIKREIRGKTVKVFTEPETFCVGECAYSGGYIYDDTWDNGLKAAGIPEALIKRVGNYLKANEPDWDDDDDYDEVPGKISDDILDEYGF